MKRRLVVELNPKPAAVLEERTRVEELNKTTIVNRALQVYGHLAAHQEAGGQIVLVKADGTAEGLVIV